MRAGGWQARIVISGNSCSQLQKNRIQNVYVIRFQVKSPIPEALEMRSENISPALILAMPDPSTKKM
jgi:hypothetical protein